MRRPVHSQLAPAALLALAAAVHAPAPCAVPAPAPPPAELPPGASLRGMAELISAGRAGEARALLRPAVEAFRRRADARGEAGCYLLLGVADVALGDNSAARSDLTQGAAKLKARGDLFGAWWALAMLGVVEQQEGRLAAALARHEEALALLDKLAASPEPLLLDSFRDVGSALGLPVGFLGRLGPQPAFGKKILLRTAELMSRDNYGSALVEAGELARAESELARAAAFSRLFLGLNDASVATHLGDLRRRQWRLDEARESYRRALERARQGLSMPFQRRWINFQVLDKLAELELLSGRVDAALAWNDQALALGRTRGARRTASLLQDRGNLLMRADRFDAAGKVFGEALALARQDHDAHRQASILIDRGALGMLRGSYGSAATDLERAIELLQGAHRPDTEAQAWSLLAEVYLLLDARGSAGAALEKARALAAKSGFQPAQALVEMLGAAERMVAGKAPPDELGKILQHWAEQPESGGMLDEQSLQVLRGAFALQAEATGGGSAPLPPGLTAAAPPGVPVLPAIACLLQGRALFLRGDFAAAREVWLKGLEKNPSKDLRSGFLAAVGATFWRQERSEEALRYFAQAADALEVPVDDLRIEELLAGYLGSERRLYFEVVIELLVRQGRIEEAFDYAERARARAFLQLVGNRRLRPARGADERRVRETEALRAQILDWERAAALAPAVEAGRIRADLEQARQRYQALMVQVKVSNPEYAALTRVEPLQLAAIQRELPPRTTLISYFVSSMGVHAWILDRTALRHVSLPLGAADLQRIGCWTDEIAHRAGGRGARLLARPCGSDRAGATSPEEAYDQLIAPLRAEIHHPRLVLVPHGVLHYVPFAALRDRRSGRYLVEEYTLTYAPSATTLRFLHAKATPFKGHALILGNPDTPSPELGPLPAAATEAAVVARAVGTTPMLGPRATKSLLYHLDGQFDLVHIAAHGIYDPVSPQFSHIALAPGEDRDGDLTVHEILSELDLAGVNLVVLSACRTAAGARSGGDEIVGLTRALLYAGTPAVISTLWDIDDDAAALLMGEFYPRLLAGSSVAEALRAAQLATLRSSRFREPRFWAAFSLTGDPETRWHAPVGGRR
jgi:CHAT domain-containing protein